MVEIGRQPSDSCVNFASLTMALLQLMTVALKDWTLAEQRDYVVIL